MSNQAAPSRFAAAHITTAPDKSADKAIITGDSGVGKTYLLSTIVSDDGRPIFIVPTEEGLKGASPLHSPAKFSDPYGNALIPETYLEMMQALTLFRDHKNAPRPPVDWLSRIGFKDDAPEADLLKELLQVFPMGLPLSVLLERSGVASSVAAPALERLDAQQRVRRGQHNNVFVRPDSSWKRPHLHFGLDSLSGCEILIHREITGRNMVQSMADKEYNALYAKAIPLWHELRDLLDTIRKTGVHVWVIAHCIEDVDASLTTGTIYRARDIMLRGSGKSLVEIRQVWRQWANSIYYIMRDVEVREGNKTRRTTAEFKGRYLVTTETAQCRAKSRLALPSVLPATWSDLRDAMKASTPASPERLRKNIQVLLSRVDIDEQAKILEAMNAATAVAQLSALLSRVEGLVICAEAQQAEFAEPKAQEDGGGEETSTSGDGAVPAPAQDQGLNNHDLPVEAGM